MHIKEIGILGPDTAKQLGFFYHRCMAIQVDLVNFARGEWDNVPIENKISILEQDLAIWKEAEDIGTELIKRLGKKGLDGYVRSSRCA